MATSSVCISVDWGTSSLRVFLVDRKTRTLLASHRSQAGILPTFRAWHREGGDRESYFRRVLAQHLAPLRTAIAPDLRGIPLVLSGMASSSVGMRELPYGDLPQPLNACRLPWTSIGPDSVLPHPLWLISGLRKPGDVMRGEEVQAFGLPSLLPDLPERCTVLLPGTHSKHLVLRQGVLVDFRTFMTGELFWVLSRHSILSESVAGADEHGHAPHDEASFGEGVLRGASDALGHTLFSLRGRHLGRSLELSQGASYLSGILIGHELRTLAADKENPILLAAGPQLEPPYRQALELLGQLDRTTILPARQVEALAWTGQLRILANLEGAR